MGKYGQTAKLAVREMQTDKNLTPKVAWENAAHNIFETHSARVKGCPKNAFLGLCEDGKVKSVNKGAYTKSIKNKDYALAALQLLHEYPAYGDDAKLLWRKVMGGESKVHNHQMDVVITLFEAGLLN